MFVNDTLVEKWKPVLDHDLHEQIADPSKRSVVATLLENTEQDVKSNNGMNPTSLLEAAPVNNIGGGNIDSVDPVLISMVRRSMPNLIAFDVAGVQPMNGPTGLIFAMRSRYTNQTGTEAFYNEANTGFSTITGGNNEIVGDANGNLGTTPTGNSETFNTAGGMSTAQAEALGSSGNAAFAEMAFDIDKVSVTAKSRALKAEYTTELAQDLKALHGLNAENELSKILSTEMLAEINREVIRTLYVTAKGGALGTTAAGTFSLDDDANGRWSVEKFKGLMFFIETEANQIAKETRRGRGNLVICSSNVAAALRMAGVLEYNPQMANNIAHDDTGNTFAGVLNGQFKVYIDPYATTDYCVVGYKGSALGDAGLFYCPYVPLQMVRAVGENTFQPKIGFKTRYGMVANPFSRGATTSDGSLVHNSNVYYRRFLITDII